MGSPPFQRRGRAGDRNWMRSHAVSPLSPAALRNSTSASPERCRTHRPVPCNRRQWARSPQIGGLENDGELILEGLGRLRCQSNLALATRGSNETAPAIGWTQGPAELILPAEKQSLRALTLVLHWFYPPAWAGEVDTGRRAEEPGNTQRAGYIISIVLKVSQRDINPKTHDFPLLS